MNNKVWLYLFFIDFFLELLATANQWNSLGLFTKPLLIPTLAVWFLFVSNDYATTRYYIVFALLFSWVGDMLLMIENKGPLYFIAGLTSFLAAHVIYIFFFLTVRKNMPDKKPWNAFSIAAVGLYAALLFFQLYPHLADLKIPVLAYTIVISTMLICARHTLSPNNKSTANWWIAGAALFVISDSLLAFNKFYNPFPLAGIAIMLTYGLAQFAIVNGTLKYLAIQNDSPFAEQPSK